MITQSIEQDREGDPVWYAAQCENGVWLEPIDFKSGLPTNSRPHRKLKRCCMLSQSVASHLASMYGAQVLCLAMNHAPDYKGRGRRGH